MNEDIRIFGSFCTNLNHECYHNARGNCVHCGVASKVLCVNCGQELERILHVDNMYKCKTHGRFRMVIASESDLEWEEYNKKRSVINE